MDLPPSRTFPSRESQDKSKVETANAVQRSGAGFHLQAAFHAETAREVIGSSNPAFAAFQPDVSAIKEERWIGAYEFARHFLAAHKMDLALATVAVEFPGIDEIGLRDTFDAVDRNDYFRELWARARIPFRESVVAFSAKGAPTEPPAEE
jgi:hypothetical protein